MSLDIFKADKKTVNTERLVFSIWENRSNPSVVDELANILSKFVDERHVFKDVEFYLPQLAHLIIHLNQNSPALHKLAVSISLTSVYAALQLTFILVAAMEDYQPELPNGMKNPSGNQFLFSRCARLLQDVERAVIYGGSSFQDRHTNGTVEPKAVKEVPFEEVDGKLRGKLLYKRVERKSIFYTKPWKVRYFVVDQKVLLCFRDANSSLPLRAIPLYNCHISLEESDKYGKTIFHLVSDINNTKYQLRAEDEAQRAKWVAFLQSEIDGAPAVVTPFGDEKEDSEKAQPSLTAKEGKPSFTTVTRRLCVSEQDMTSAQRKRFHHFHHQRIFITNLTNIAEKLRFKERPLRKFFLRRDMRELQVPPLAYIPMCSSLDHFRSILRTLPAEAYAFNTKARCPALMYFEVQQHPSHTDVATFLGAEIESYHENELTSPGLAVINYCGARADYELSSADMEAPALDPDVVERKQSPFHNATKGAIWKPDGTGIRRLEEEGSAVVAELAKKSAGAHSAEEPTSEGSSGASLKADDITLDVTATANEVMGESFEEKTERIRKASPYGHLDGWKLDGLIAKSNDDVRQEVFVMQLIGYYKQIFQAAGLPVWLYTYQILSTSKSTGLIQLIPDAISLDGLKKSDKFPGTLRAYFEKTYGGAGSPQFEAAVEAYVQSMAAYSIVSYLLAIKDRHNGNVMIDRAGHFIHIDFGFVFGLAPGKAFSMEKAPWKLTKEFADVMGGRGSPHFNDYVKRCKDALLVARKHGKEVRTMLEIMRMQSNYPSFRYNPHAIQDFEDRLFLHMSEEQLEQQVHRMINTSYKHVGTDLYDDFQVATNGIAK